MFKNIGQCIILIQKLIPNQEQIQLEIEKMYNYSEDKKISLSMLQGFKYGVKYIINKMNENCDINYNFKTNREINLIKDIKQICNNYNVQFVYNNQTTGIVFYFEGESDEINKQTHLKSECFVQKQFGFDNLQQFKNFISDNNIKCIIYNNLKFPLDNNDKFLITMAVLDKIIIIHNCQDKQIIVNKVDNSLNHSNSNKINIKKGGVNIGEKGPKPTIKPGRKMIGK